MRSSWIIPLAALGLLAAVPSQALTVLGTGENFAVEYDHTNQNVVGGGAVRVINGGESARYLHDDQSLTQAPRWAFFQGQGESGQIVYGPR